MRTLRSYWGRAHMYCCPSPSPSPNPSLNPSPAFPTSRLHTIPHRNLGHTNHGHSRTFLTTHPPPHTARRPTRHPSTHQMVASVRLRQKLGSSKPTNSR